jgi:hypothetical protein
MNKLIIKKLKLKKNIKKKKNKSKFMIKYFFV